MAMFKCKNFGSCSRADSCEEFSLVPGTDDKCPECGSTLVRVGEETSDHSNGGGASKRKTVLIATSVGVLLLVLASVAYVKWSASQVVVLKPDISAKVSTPSPAATASLPIAPNPPSPNTATSSVEKPAPMVANEAAARKSCDEATKAKQPDADKVCSRATAVTLMNSGVLSAIDGKLDQAEKDYLAAKEKDPDLPELYFNLAVLKARQNKGSEAVDNLTLASTKGFTQFSALKSEPSLQKLKSDPALKSRIEAFETK